MSKILRIPVILICTFLFLFQAPAAAQKGRTKKEIKKLMAEYNGIGLAVVVVKNNKIAYTHSFGYQDKEASKRLKKHDIFRIASISKSFSATSIMQLVEAGKLTLDDDFSKLVGFRVRNPKYPDVVITLRMVMSHTSSINDSQGYFQFDVINPEKNPHFDSCYNEYKPGEGYMYCNLNYNMVGAVIERASGQRFDQYVVNHILRPLGLYGGYCIDSLDQSRFAKLYEYDSTTRTFTEATNAYNPRRDELKNYFMGYSTPAFSPTGGMKISAIDLAKYMTMHMNYGDYKGTRIMSEVSSKEMQASLSEAEHYGLALFTTDKYISGKVLKGHTGSAYGLYSNMFFSPQEKFGFVLITNGCNPVYSEDFNEFLLKSARVLYKNFIEE